ncbi:VOC family protein [Rhizobium leguminosarum]|uniref:VOC family protein n=1 Tax=Rhizobium leguminosarum TaxID=384 RepID=UPI003965698B|nr:VOC family protein [Rhizobium leguminosarum]
MIHHVSVGTNDVARSKRFYDAVLPIVGIVPMAEDEGGLGYGSGTFHFSVQVPIDGKPATVGNGTHIAFAVEDRSMVNRFYAAALNMVAATMALLGCGRTMMRTIMELSSAIRTVTRSRP